MKKFTIEASGKTLFDVIYAIEEAKRNIENGYSSGMDSNEDGEYTFESSGDYEDENYDA